MTACLLWFPQMSFTENTVLYGPAVEEGNTHTHTGHTDIYIHQTTCISQCVSVVTGDLVAEQKLKAGKDIHETDDY